MSTDIVINKQKIQLKKKIDVNNQTKKKIVLKNTDIGNQFTEKHIIDYGNNTYCILMIDTQVSGQQTKMPIVIDYEDYTKIKYIKWNRVGKYIGHVYMIDGVKKVLY